MTAVTTCITLVKLNCSPDIHIASGDTNNQPERQKLLLMPTLVAAIPVLATQMALVAPLALVALIPALVTHMARQCPERHATPPPQLPSPDAAFLRIGWVGAG